MKVWPAAVARVHEEVADMLAIAKAEGDDVSAIEPWDYLYYAEKVREGEVRPRSDRVKPYFELNNMIAGVVLDGRASSYGLSFTEVTGVDAGLHHGRPGVGSEGQGQRQARRPVLRRLLRARATSARARGPGVPGARDVHRQPTSTPIMSNNNNFVKGAAERAGARSRSTTPRRCFTSSGMPCTASCPR